MLDGEEDYDRDCNDYENQDYPNDSGGYGVCTHFILPPGGDFVRFCKCIISGFMAIAIVTSLCIPVFAVDPDVVVGAMEVAPDFGSWLWDTAKTGGNLIAGFLDDDYCTGAETSLNGRHNFVPQHTQVDGKTGMFYICSACGKSAGEVLEPAYDDYVQTLPYPGYTSNGGLIWQPTFADLSYITVDVFKYETGSSSAVLGRGDLKAEPSGTTIPIEIGGPSSGAFQSRRVKVNQAITDWPIAGSYHELPSLYWSCRAVKEDGTACEETTNRSGEDKFVHHSPGTEYLFYGDYTPYGGPLEGRVTYSYYVYYLPTYEIIPDTAISGNTYSTTTRPTSITGGNYGVVGDNNEITKVEDNSTIINETNNTYYNPATGTTVPITNWSYDYSDRSYKVTTETGDTATITYGDENISITETNTTSGDTITNNYTIYYLVDAPDPSACTHNWTETSTTPATCTVPGSRLLTCSLCSQTKSESIPVLGHDWEVKKTVTTQYDETGQLTQQGYTIFECSRCHEQYKSEDGVLPPGGSSAAPGGGDADSPSTIGGLVEKLLSGVGSIVGGIIKGLLSLLTKAVEALAGIADLFTQFVGSVVSLFGAFTDFLSAVFPFIPSELITILELGVILMVAAAVFRKFLS